MNKNHILTNSYKMTLAALICTQNEKIQKYIKYKYNSQIYGNKLTNLNKPKTYFPNEKVINNINYIYSSSFRHYFQNIKLINQQQNNIYHMYMVPIQK